MRAALEQNYGYKLFLKKVVVVVEVVVVVLLLVLGGGGGGEVWGKGEGIIKNIPTS